MNDDNKIYVVPNEKPIKAIFDGIVTITSKEDDNFILTIPFKHIQFKGDLGVICQDDFTPE